MLIFLVASDGFLYIQTKLINTGVDREPSKYNHLFLRNANPPSSFVEWVVMIIPIRKNNCGILTELCLYMSFQSQFSNYIPFLFVPCRDSIPSLTGNHYSTNQFSPNWAIQVQTGYCYFFSKILEGSNLSLANSFFGIFIRT